MVYGRVHVSEKPSREEWRRMKRKRRILTAGGRVVVEVQGFHDQRVRPLQKKTEEKSDELTTQFTYLKYSI